MFSVSLIGKSGQAAHLTTPGIMDIQLTGGNLCNPYPFSNLNITVILSLIIHEEQRLASSRFTYPLRIELTIN